MSKENNPRILKCCICYKVFTGYGNNPQPVEDYGECCNTCNNEKVIPMRLMMMDHSKYYGIRLGRRAL